MCQHHSVPTEQQPIEQPIDLGLMFAQQRDGSALRALLASAYPVQGDLTEIDAQSALVEAINTTPTSSARTRLWLQYHAQYTQKRQRRRAEHVAALLMAVAIAVGIAVYCGLL